MNSRRHIPDNEITLELRGKLSRLETAFDPKESQKIINLKFFAHGRYQKERESFDNQSDLVSINFFETVDDDDEEDDDGIDWAEGTDGRDELNRDDRLFLDGTSDFGRDTKVSFSKSFVGTCTIIESFSFLLEFPLRRVNFPDLFPRARNFFPKKKSYSEKCNKNTACAKEQN